MDFSKTQILVPEVSETVSGSDVAKAIKEAPKWNFDLEPTLGGFCISSKGSSPIEDPTNKNDDWNWGSESSEPYETVGEALDELKLSQAKLKIRDPEDDSWGFVYSNTDGTIVLVVPPFPVKELTEAEKREKHKNSVEYLEHKTQTLMSFGPCALEDFDY